MEYRELYCFNATVLGSHRRVGVVINYDQNLFSTPSVQAVLEHPDKFSFSLLSFVPVWIKDIYESWFRWQCMHGEQCCELALFKESLSFYNRVFTLDVKALITAYDPFRLQRWIWGCGQVTRLGIKHAIIDKRFAKVIAHGANGVDSDYHNERIAYLVENKDVMPIHIYGTAVLNSPFIVENGNHRLAAAMIRGDKTINATMSGNVSLLRPYLVTKMEIEDDAWESKCQS